MANELTVIINGAEYRLRHPKLLSEDDQALLANCREQLGDIDIDNHPTRWPRFIAVVREALPLLVEGPPAVIKALSLAQVAQIVELLNEHDLLTADFTLN